MIMRCLILCLLSVSALGQQDIQSIVDRNPFDPDRGRKDVTDEPEEVEEAPPADLPILEGTIILGQVKIAIFSYIEEGKRASARVKENDKVAGYLVTQIDRSLVKLRGVGEPINVELYSGKKTKRGGSKASNKVTKQVIKNVDMSGDSNANPSQAKQMPPPTKIDRDPNQVRPPLPQSGTTARPPTTQDRKQGKF